MAKKSTQTVTIKIELTDDMLNKLGASIAKAMVDNNVLSLSETEQAKAKADTEPNPETPQTPTAPTSGEQQATQVQNNTPAEMPVAPMPNPNFTPQPTAMPPQAQAPAAQGYPVQQPQMSYPQQTTPAQMPYTQNAQPTTTPQAIPNYPVNAAGPAPGTPGAFAATPTAMPNAASAVNPQSAQNGNLTLDVICNAAAALIDNGKMGEVLNILHSYGVDTATALKPEYFPPVADALRALGAAI